MLEVKDLTKKYGRTLAADRIGFTVPDEQIGILLGPNGAGKSTVIKSIAGLLRYQGTIRIQGQDSRTFLSKLSLCLVWQRVILVPQNICQPKCITSECFCKPGIKSGR